MIYMLRGFCDRNVNKSAMSAIYDLFGGENALSFRRRDDAHVPPVAVRDQIKEFARWTHQTPFSAH
jgi:hypothetical protein